MIVNIFDNGWGPEYPVKQLETEILKTTIAQLQQDARKIVVINSTWYTHEYHQKVLQYLRETPVDLIVLVAMLDSAIPNSKWFDEINVEVLEIGYYPGPGEIDFWAIFMDRNFFSPHTIELCRIDHITKPFMCLNRKPHWHRKLLYQQICDLNLQNIGLVSMGSDNGIAVQEISNDVGIIELAPNSGRSQNGIPNDISTLGNIDNWASCFLNVVTETVYDINQHHFVSEKIFKPMLGMRPFLVYDPDGATKWLTERGFQHYCDDFTDISNLDLRDPKNIAPFLAVLSDQPRHYWQKKLLDLSQKIVYNKQQFYKYVDVQKLKMQKGIICLT